MPDRVEELNDWLHKYLTHSTRFRNVMVSLAQVLIEKQEWELLVDLGECMEDTGNDIIELMEILKEHARSAIT